MTKPQWEYAPTGGGTEDGINNPMIEHFEGNYNYHLAREIIQNAIDARKNESKPVIVDYSLLYFNQNEFPGRDKLEDIISKCINYYNEDAKAQKLLNSAISCIQNEKIPVLKISDHNTIGLHGSDTEKKLPWYNLVKSRGSSSKSGGEGGSFGLGKGAPYAASHLRTIYYSTKSEIDGKSRFIGVSELVSHLDEDIIKRGVGSYGYKNQSTIMNPEDMSDFWRRETGLDIYIMGFKIGEDWKNDLIKSVLRNFWYAILNEDLIVKIDNKEICFSNIQELMSHYFFDEPYRDYIKPLGNPLYYMESFLNGEEFETELKNIGKVRFHFRQIDERLNYVAMMRRSHMIIYSKSFHFPAPFAGVFICDDLKGNEELRKMEPPTHDIWDPARYIENGKKIMDEIEEWIRVCLKELRQTREDEILEIPDLYKLLPYEEGDESGNGKGDFHYTGKEGNEETSKLINESVLCRLKSKIDPHTVTIFNEEELGFSGEKKIIRKGKKKIKNKNKDLAGGKGKNKVLSENEVNTRIFGITKNYRNQEYLVIIKSNINGRCDLKINGIGEFGSEKIKVLEIKDPRGHKYKLANNYIKGFYLEENTEIKLKMKIDNKLKCSLSLVAYEI